MVRIDFSMAFRRSLSSDLLYLCFPHAAHDEKAWGMRLHLPMQLFTGMVARASRGGDPLLQNPPE
jgi:hypothetical protein